MYKRRMAQVLPPAVHTAVSIMMFDCFPNCRRSVAELLGMKMIMYGLEIIFPRLQRIKATAVQLRVKKSHTVRFSVRLLAVVIEVLRDYPQPVSRRML
jgi:hypothetical protein